MKRLEPSAFGATSPSAVDRIVSELRERALAVREGETLGSEEELSTAFGVSKPTLRQAARLLQYEGVLEVKRGIRGGYFATRPKLDTITRLAAIYLRSNPTSNEAIADVLESLIPLITKSAIKNGDLDAFRVYAVMPEGDPATFTSEDMIRSEGGFTKLLMDSTGNFALRMIFMIFYQFGFTVPRQQRAMPGRSEVIKLRVALAQALIARDVDRATELLLLRSRLINGGMREDLKRTKKPSKGSN